MMQNKLKIAITGGIGSGKSAVAEIIKNQGFSVFSCDEIYKELLRDKQFLNLISLNFDGVLSADGELDRQKLSDIVFNDKTALGVLNNITQPSIMDELLRQCESKNIAFAEVPLLFENGFEKLFNGVIIVLRNEEDRISAICKRDKISVKKAKLRLKAQFNYNNCEFAEYYVIHNDGNFQDLERDTLNVIGKIKAKYLKNF